MDEPEQDKPEDLSVKTSPPMPATTTKASGLTRKVKPIPPPLDLNACNLEEPSDLRTPKSPGDLPRECLPLRKRPLLDAKRDLHAKSPRSAGPADRVLFSNIEFQPRDTNTAPSSPSSTISFTTYPSLTVTSSSSSHLTLTPSSAKSLSAFTPFAAPSLPHPPPLIPSNSVHNPSHMQAAAAMTASVLAAAAAASYSPKSPFANPGGFPTPPTELANASYSWTSPTSLGGLFPPPFSPVVPISPLPFTSTALLSPAPSHPSSTNSSREDLPMGSGTGNNVVEETKRRFFNATYVTSANNVQSPSSPLNSPMNRVATGPNPCWQCFMAGTRIRFLIPNTNTPWQRAEELGWKDKIAAKIDSRNHYQFAPNGLTVLKLDTLEPSESDEVSRVLIRMGPHNCDNALDILAECSICHPFFVKDKGWCSIRPRVTFEKYGIPCKDLSLGDVCLPPDHQDAVRTPDLCDRFRKFEFSTASIASTAVSSETDPGSPLPVRGSSTGIHRPVVMHHGVQKNQTMSPPMSPARKKEKDVDKPKRPMNGFMLFAKKYRLELIQQHPGKDNRAISVLLGEAWKSLPIEERDLYSQRAKLLADEKKKLYPDCWKRKRTVNSASAATSNSSSKDVTPPSPHVLSSPMIGTTHLIKQEGSL